MILETASLDVIIDPSRVTQMSSRNRKKTLSILLVNQ